ncbi:histone-lysine N-methyltransferase SMYD3 [Aplochiton taeniatus]
MAIPIQQSTTWIFGRCDSLLRCSQCKTARYCDVTCQKGAWPSHRRECKCLQSLLPRVPTDSVRLAARILFTMLGPPQDRGQELYSVEDHESHLEEMSEEKMEGLAHLSSMLQLYLQQEVKSSPPSTCLDPLSLIARVTCNCFTISDGELQEVGVGLYPSMSLLNHDCRPSCVVTFEGATLCLRATRDIQPSEELTISYIGCLAPTNQRQKQLKDQYHFLCQCHRCSTEDMDGLMLSGEEQAWSPLKEVLPRLEKLQAEGDWEAVLEGCSSLLSPAGGAVPGENVYRLRVTDLALDACINLEHWEQALAYGEATLTAYRLYHPDPHPAHAVQLMRVGKLQHFLVQLEPALNTLRQAYDIVKVTHGDQHPLTSDLSRKLEECRAEIDHA